MSDLEKTFTKHYGPLPLWVYLLGGFGLYHIYSRTSNKVPVPPVVTMTNDPERFDQKVKMTTVNDSFAYAPPMTFPLPNPNDVPTPGSQGGPRKTGFLPFTMPATFAIGRIIDPTTGRPICSGPNGEGGKEWNPGEPIHPGQAINQMADGRWATYLPHRNIQNGNRAALGLMPLESADSTSPQSNPAAIGWLKEQGVKDYASNC